MFKNPLNKHQTVQLFNTELMTTVYFPELSETHSLKSSEITGPDNFTRKFYQTFKRKDQFSITFSE